jgi:4-hydroxybenzoate polyprenyltransferase
MVRMAPSLTRIHLLGQTNPMRSIAALIRASHPEPAVAVTTVAALVAVATGRPWVGVVAAASAVLASQLAVGWVNDAIDAERDAAVGRADKPIPAGAISRRTVAVAGAVAAVATVPLALLSGPWAAAVATVGLVSSLLYDWPLKSTPISVLPYAVSFAALPAFVVLGLPGAPRPPVWMLVAGALMGAGAHFANTLPDLADDARTGVRGLPHRIGPAASRVAAAGLLLAATAVLAFGPPGSPSWFGLAAFLAAAVVLPIAGYAASRRPASRVVFRAVLLVAIVDVALLVAGGLSV